MPSTSPRMPRRRRAQRGAVAVELALLLPLLVMLVVGTLTGGLSYFNKISLADAVREGARFGATADIADPNWASNVYARTNAAAAGVLDPLDQDVCVQLIDAGGAVTDSSGCTGSPAPPAAAPPASLLATCVVRVWATKHTEFSVGVWSSPIDLTQESYTRYERAAC